MSTDVGILLYEGFDELAAVGAHAVLAAAAATAPIEVTTYSLVPSETVPAAAGLAVAPDDVLIGTPDLVLVPGGPWGDADPSGAAAAADAEYADRVATLADNGASVAAVASGVRTLGEADRLDGRTVAVPAGRTDAVSAYGATGRATAVLDDGGLVTAATPADGLELALHLVREKAGEELATDLGERFGVEVPSDTVVRVQE